MNDGNCPRCSRKGTRNRSEVFENCCSLGGGQNLRAWPASEDERTHMTRLFVLYDAQCSFCLRCRQWLGMQPSFSPLEFIPYQTPELVAQFEGIESFRTKIHLLV